MAILSTGNTFGATDTVTSTKLNNIADAATFDDPVDDSTLELHTDGKLRIKDSGVTKAKIENVADMKVLGNTSGSATAPQEVSVLDEDDMSSDSATALATQQSIKAYADAAAQSAAMQYSGSTGTIAATPSFSDLDLSSVVGSNRAFVMLEITGTANSNTFIRPKGSTLVPYSGYTGANNGASGAVVDSTGVQGGIVITTTDASGVIEIKTNNSNTISYTVLAYQVLQ